MGISIEQYRASIGMWSARRVNSSQASLYSTEPEYPDPVWSDDRPVLRGPWKLHALLLCVALVTLCLMQPCPTAAYYNALPPVQCNSHKNASLYAPQDTDFRLNSIINHQCLNALLIIGGVEQNPGPTLSADTIEEHNEVIAGLCAEAPVDIRDTLRLYDPSLETRGLERQIARSSKNLLIAALEYLGIPGMQDYTKEACVTSLICRIQNLLPDTCGLCKEKYCIALSVKPLLTCAICGQGSHDSCIKDYLKLPEDKNGTLSPEEAQRLLNPSGLPGLHYLCAACEDSSIPSKGDGKLKQKSKSTTQLNAQEGVPVEEEDCNNVFSVNQAAEKTVDQNADPGNTGNLQSLSHGHTSETQPVTEDDRTRHDKSRNPEIHTAASSPGHQTTHQFRSSGSASNLTTEPARNPTKPAGQTSRGTSGPAISLSTGQATSKTETRPPQSYDICSFYKKGIRQKWPPLPERPPTSVQETGDTRIGSKIASPQDNKTASGS